jgi:hypothetical protein
VSIGGIFCPFETYPTFSTPVLVATLVILLNFIAIVGPQSVSGVEIFSKDEAPCQSTGIGGLGQILKKPLQNKMDV